MKNEIEIDLMLTFVLNYTLFQRKIDNIIHLLVESPEITIEKTTKTPTQQLDADTTNQ